MRRQAWNRLAAWIIDWLCILAWVAVLAAVGVPLHLGGMTDDVSARVGNVIAAVILVVPVTIVLALLESGAQEASVGKRIRRLHVVDVDTGATVPFGRTLLRNVLKISVPWTLGHVVVYGLSRPDANGIVPGWIWAATAAAYVLPLIYVIALFVRRGRTPYDWAARTIVIANR